MNRPIQIGSPTGLATKSTRRIALSRRRLLLLLVVASFGLLSVALAAPQTIYITFQLYIHGRETSGNPGRSGLLVTLADSTKFDPNTNEGFVDIFANYSGISSGTTPSPAPNLYVAACRNGTVGLPLGTRPQVDSWHNVMLRLAVDDVTGILSSLDMNIDGVTSPLLTLTTPLKIDRLYLGNFRVSPDIHQYAHVIDSFKIGRTQYGNEIFGPPTGPSSFDSVTGGTSISITSGRVRIDYTSNGDAYGEKSISLAGAASPTPTPSGTPSPTPTVSPTPTPTDTPTPTPTPIDTPTPTPTPTDTPTSTPTPTDTPTATATP
jgi:hypothetical protein